MFRSLKELFGYRLQAQDGILGHVHDALFDDEKWFVRYLVAETGFVIPWKKVLLSPTEIHQPEWSDRLLPVNLTKEQVKQSPPLEADQPVSRQYLRKLHLHYSWPVYWDPGEEQEPGDPHLRSAREVIGYSIEATDGDIGHAEDLVVEDKAWLVRYLVVDTKNWWPGKKVLVSPDWVEEIVWNSRRVVIPFDRETVKNCPEYDPFAPVNREYEMRLYDYYGRPAYWG